MYVFRLPEHLKRLVNSCKIFGFDLKYSVEEMTKATVETVRRNDLHEKCYIRPLVYIGFGGMGINFTGFPVHTAFLAYPFGKYFKGEGVAADGPPLGGGPRTRRALPWPRSAGSTPTPFWGRWRR